MLQKQQEIIKDCISMDTLRQMMSDAGVRKTNIVLFDACREKLRGKTTKKTEIF
jgi:hypothetical protein